MNIGLLVSELEDRNVKKIIAGAIQAADDKGISLVILPGKYIVQENNEVLEKTYDCQYSAIFDYANTSDFDVLIVDIDRIGKNATILKKEAFLKSFDKVPILTLTEQEGFTSVNEIKTGHKQFEQFGYQAVCDAVFYVNNGTISELEHEKEFAKPDIKEGEALSTISKIGYELFNHKYREESAYDYFINKALEYGIKNCGIYLYDKKVKNNLKFKWEKPHNITVKSIAVDGNIVESKENIADTDKIFSDYVKSNSNILIAGTIFVEEYQLGIFITDFNNKFYFDNCFEILLSMVTGVSRLSYLEKELRKTNEELYEVQEELARDDSVLDHIGDQDYLTGGLNRRGFFAKAYDLLKEEFKPGKYAIVSYIHMDSLKRINEMYGHEEGDRAVRKISDILEEVFEKCIYGRIRGDEFAVIEITDDEEKAESFRQDMSAQNAKLLEESSRYMNHLQYSICEFSYDENLSLRDMLKETDESLQKIKVMQ